MRRGAFEVRADTAFREVIRGCATNTAAGAGRHLDHGRDDRRLHRSPRARGSPTRSKRGRTAGWWAALYGVSLGAVFFGESMFADVPNASKVAFATLLANLIHWRFHLVDCQSYTDHLAGFGAGGMAARPLPGRPPAGAPRADPPGPMDPGAGSGRGGEGCLPALSPLRKSLVGLDLDLAGPCLMSAWAACYRARDP